MREVHAFKSYPEHGYDDEGINLPSVPGTNRTLTPWLFALTIASARAPYASRRRIEQYCARMGVKNVRAVQGDAAVFRSDWEHAFDGVLCDVPCSGLGTLCENPDIALRRPDFQSLSADQTLKFRMRFEKFPDDPVVLLFQQILEHYTGSLPSMQG